MTAWTTPSDVERKLRRRWRSGAFLARLGEGRPWESLAVPLRGPTARDVASDLDKARAWARSWERAGRRFDRIEYKRVGGRLVGTNELPAKVWIDSYERLWSVLGVEREAAQFAELVADGRARAPRLVPWMLKHPMRLLELEPDWSEIVDVVLWIDARADGDLFLRQVDLGGVDTKFIERHRTVLAELLDHQLDERRVDSSQPRSAFAARYGLRQRPVYVRLRALGSGQRLAGGFSEVSVRLDELAHSPPGHGAVYVIENEITYLAFPPVEDALALFGGGYSVTILEQLGWLADRELVYWGDIDTHGFAILDRLRQRFPHAASMLMDRATLLAHSRQWVQEPRRHASYLECLNLSEREIYHDLVENTLGDRVRLEQERISYSLIEKALATRAFSRRP